MFAPRATTVALVLPDRAGLLERIGLAAAQLGLVAPKLPLPFYDAYLGLLGARAVMAATRLGIVEALAERPDTVDCLARRLALDAERLDVLLTALVTLGYVRRRRDGRFAPTRTARRWLTGDRSVEGFAGPLAYANWEAMRGLEDALRGAPPTGWHERPDDDPQWEGYQRAMAQMERMLGDDLAAAIPVEAPRTLLDLAGGPGLHAAALIRRHPGLQATVVDLPAAVAHAQPLEGVAFVAGDLFGCELPTGVDLVTAHSLLHNFPPQRCAELLTRAHEALRPGGLLVAQELERPPAGRRGSRISGLGALAFTVTMGGRTYTACDLARHGGFVDVRVVRPVRLPGCVLLLARRA